MSYEGVTQRIFDDGSYEVFDVFNDPYDEFFVEFDKELKKKCVWSRSVHLTNGENLPDEPSSWFFPLNENCSQHVGWIVEFHEDYEGTVYKTRKPKFRPPTKQEYEEFILGIENFQLKD